MFIYFDQNKIYESVGSIGNLVELQIDIPETVLKYHKRLSKKLIEGEKITYCSYFDTEEVEYISFRISNNIRDIQIEYNILYFCSKKHHKNMRKDSDKRNQYLVWKMDGDKRIEIVKELNGKQEYLNYLKEL